MLPNFFQRTFIVLILVMYFSAHAQYPLKVQDLQYNNETITPYQVKAVGSSIFIIGATPSLGKELFVTDGTTGDLHLVKDINPGTENSDPLGFTALSPTLTMFSAVDATMGREIWITDGTEAGTKRITSMGTDFSVAGTGFHAFQDYFYFGVRPSGDDAIIYRTQGTTESTEAIVNLDTIRVLLTGYTNSPEQFLTFKDKFYFVCNYSLYESDGTPEGTIDLLGKFNAEQSEVTFEKNYGTPIVYKDQLIFATQYQSFIYDGTEFTKDRTLGGLGLESPIQLGDKLLFMDKESDEIGFEFYITESNRLTDATFLGDLEPTYNRGLNPIYIQQLNGKLLFVGQELGDIGKELYITDGTPEGTGIVKDIYAGANEIGQIQNGLGHMTNQTTAQANSAILQDRIIFSAEDSYQNRRELWITDGTEEGTSLLKNFATASGVASSPSGFVTVGREVYFTIYNPTTTLRELWVITGESNRIFEGRVYHDLNKNKILDSDEFPIASSRVILSPTNQIAFTNEEGKFAFLVDTDGNYSITADLDSSFILTTDSITYHASRPGDSQRKFDFGLLFTDTLEHNMNIHVRAGRFRCNTETFMKLHVTNEGKSASYMEITASPNIDIGLNAVSIEPDAGTLGGTLQYFFDNFQPLEQFELKMDITIPGVEVGIGEPLSNQFKLQVFEGNTPVYTYYYIYQQILFCSYDPNDKAVSPAGIVPMSQEYLDYTIRFENTGNDTAYTVTIKDTLDEDLDLLSLELLGASHVVNMTLVGREVTFLFDNIYLPDSTTDHDAAQGYVSYRVKPLPEIKEHALVTNTAYIVFDANPTIITNTVTNEFANVITGTTDSQTQTSASLFPNPVNQSFRLKSASPIALVDVIDLTGKPCAQYEFGGGSIYEIELPAQYLQSGVYQVIIHTVEGIQTLQLNKN